MATTPNSWFWTNTGSTGSSAPATLFDVELIEGRPGIIVFRVNGPKAAQLFENEAGGHRHQRVPPTERKGRVHTSTITVAVLPEPSSAQMPEIPARDIEWTATRGSGAGGQNRNKRDTAVQMRHIPSGLTIRCEAERSQNQNRVTALALLRAKLWATRSDAAANEEAALRKWQVGSGQRGDKRRTIRADGVVDHYTGKTWRFKDYVRGIWE